MFSKRAQHMNKYTLMTVVQQQVVCEAIDQGFPNWAKCTPRGTFRLFKGTLLCERISLFKLNSVSGRNNRLKCLEFSNLVDCYYVKQDN